VPNKLINITSEIGISHYRW